MINEYSIGWIRGDWLVLYRDGDEVPWNVFAEVDTGSDALHILNALRKEQSD